jgi:hypothetical protein
MPFVWDRSDGILDMSQHSPCSFYFSIFMEIVVTIAWCIWILRNSAIFDGKSLSLGFSKCSLHEELALVVFRWMSHPVQFGIWPVVAHVHVMR